MVHFFARGCGPVSYTHLLNGGTRKMRERYDQIDRELLPLLPNDSECREKLGRKIPKAGNISEYIQKNASYPVYQNTEMCIRDRHYPGEKFSGRKSEYCR